MVILVSPDRRAAMPEILWTAIAIEPAGPSAIPLSLAKTRNTRRMMKMPAKPTDHLPERLFGKTYIRTMLF